MSIESGEQPHQQGHRYAIFGEVASGGMATVHFARLIGPAGFNRIVAVKRLFPQFARDPEFVAMFLDEARLAARVRHPNVVSTLDVVTGGNDLFLVMDYIHGESLAGLLRHTVTKGERVPPAIASAILSGALHGLHAAHEATDEFGELLHLVHRDMSPQNILVGADGVPRVLDFGVAKALGRAHTTRDGQVKGKLSYMAPEQLRGAPITRATDIFAAGAVLWQTLTGQKLFQGDTEAIIVAKVLEESIIRPSRVVPSIDPELDRVTLQALARDPARRFSSAREMALALEAAVRPATTSELSAWVASVAGESLAERAETIAQIESRTARPAPLIVEASTADPARQPPEPFSANTVQRPVAQGPTWSGAGMALATLVAVATVAVATALSQRSTPAHEAPRANATGPDVEPRPAASSTVLASAPPEASSGLAPVASALAVAPEPARSSAPRAPNRPPSKTDCYYVDSEGIRRIHARCR